MSPAPSALPSPVLCQVLEASFQTHFQTDLEELKSEQKEMQVEIVESQEEIAALMAIQHKYKLRLANSASAVVAGQEKINLLEAARDKAVDDLYRHKKWSAVEKEEREAKLASLTERHTREREARRMTDEEVKAFKKLQKQEQEQCDTLQKETRGLAAQKHKLSQRLANLQQRYDTTVDALKEAEARSASSAEKLKLEKDKVCCSAWLTLLSSPRGPHSGV